jgi:hypothetical protein
MNREEIAGAVARGWCAPATENKVMDAELAMAITDEVWNLLNPPNLGCATTRQLLEELTARIEVGGFDPSSIGKSALDYRTVDSHA